MGNEPFGFRAKDFVPIDLQEVDRDVFVTPYLTPAAARRILHEADLRSLEAARTEPRRPNSMHDHGAMLEGLGLATVVDELLAASPDLQSLLAERFGAVGGDDLDSHHSYLVDYGAEGDEDLGFHVDDSEVTLNLCLGEDFSGAELVMLGRRCDEHRQTPVQAGETVEIEHEPGVLVVHAGRHRHRVDPIRRGRRRNLIAWMRSSRFRARTEGPAAGPGGGPVHPPWCGWSEG